MLELMGREWGGGEVAEFGDNGGGKRVRWLGRWGRRARWKGEEVWR